MTTNSADTSTDTKVDSATQVDPKTEIKTEPTVKPDATPASTTYTQEQYDAVMEEAKLAQGNNDKLLALYKSTVLNLLPPEERTKAEALIKAAEEEAGREASTTQLETRELGIRARELAIEFSAYDVKAEDLLKDAKTASDLEVKALRAKADFLEKNPAGKADPSKLPSDRGGGGNGGGNGTDSKYPAFRGKGDQAILNHLADIREQRAKAGNSSST